MGSRCPEAEEKEEDRRPKLAIGSAGPPGEVPSSLSVESWRSPPVRGGACAGCVVVVVTLDARLLQEEKPGIGEDMICW